MWRWLFAFVLLLSVNAQAARQSTAYEALQVVGGQFHRAALQRIISVSGVNGDPQPVEWTVLIADRRAPGGVRELRVAEGRIVSDRTPAGSVTGSAEGAIVRTSQLNLDSSGAFAVASYTADKSHTNFDRVAYTLRTNERGIPVWIVTLQDAAGSPLGTIHMSANRGNVTRVEGMYRGANIANVEQDPAGQGVTGEEEYYDAPDYGEEGVAEGEEEVDPEENAVKARLKRAFRKTKNDALRVFKKVRRPFDEFIDRRLKR